MRRRGGAARSTALPLPWPDPHLPSPFGGASSSEPVHRTQRVRWASAQRNSLTGRQPAGSAARGHACGPGPSRCTRRGIAPSAWGACGRGSWLRRAVRSLAREAGRKVQSPRGDGASPVARLQRGVPEGPLAPRPQRQAEARWSRTGRRGPAASCGRSPQGKRNIHAPRQAVVDIRAGRPYLALRQFWSAADVRSRRRLLAIPPRSMRDHHFFTVCLTSTHRRLREVCMSGSSTSGRIAASPRSSPS
jgi:hypothetical protein